MSDPAEMTTPLPPEVLVIMARYPEEGEVKKRLARDLGVQKTLTLYRAFLEDLASKFGSMGRPLLWYYTPRTSPFSALFANRFPCRPQADSSLQDRLLHVFEELFSEGCRRIVVMGADVPHLPVHAVEEAFDALKGMDVVMMPADDGGYNLIGLRAPHDLFTGVLLGTGDAFRETEARASSLGLSLHCLAPFFDVDTIGDLERLVQYLFETDDAIPRTREALAVIGQVKG